MLATDSNRQVQHIVEDNKELVVGTGMAGTAEHEWHVQVSERVVFHAGLDAMDDENEDKSLDRVDSLVH